MALHRRHLGRDSERPYWTSLPYLDIQKRIGKIPREHYQPPKDLPHQLLTLLLEVNQQEDGRRGDCSRRAQKRRGEGTNDQYHLDRY
jgi:hypothetical protein